MSVWMCALLTPALFVAGSVGLLVGWVLLCEAVRGVRRVTGRES